MVPAKLLDLGQHSLSFFVLVVQISSELISYFHFFFCYTCGSFTGKLIKSMNPQSIILEEEHEQIHHTEIVLFEINNLALIGFGADAVLGFFLCLSMLFVKFEVVVCKL